MAPPQGQMRPGRQLAVLGLLFVVLYLLVFLGGSGSIRDRLEPKLGLDLIGGSRVTYTATTADGQAPQADQLEEARQIIESRANAYGVSEAEVVTEGDKNIVVSLAGESDDALANLGQAAELRFRKVIKATADMGAIPPAPTASAAPSGTPGPRRPPRARRPRRPRVLRRPAAVRVAARRLPRRPPRRRRRPRRVPPAPPHRARPATPRRAGTRPVPRSSSWPTPRRRSATRPGPRRARWRLRRT
ncbi:hypothetical protein Pflav_006250 [Phytohabitans flavus]|uniref:Protein translocase subunit SecDF P1 domain-containing protein n=1 Tax=Phytohabitans flavus TaxID=1076124 RepID=A0A6F8XK75_9ACTN|nr:hypothetical protein Pflav_006250 [Phytohabitans flavus]